jgi:hypothetical protein
VKKAKKQPHRKGAKTQRNRKVNAVLRVSFAFLRLCGGAFEFAGL